MTTERTLCDGAIVMRPDRDGAFDELLMMDGERCLVHVEMMGDNLMWIGFYPEGKNDRVCLWISGKRGHLSGKRGKYLGISTEENGKIRESPRRRPR